MERDIYVSGQDGSEHRVNAEDIKKYLKKDDGIVAEEDHKDHPSKKKSG
jgi:hypothetical protein